MRQCAPAFDVEVLAEACGTPWNFKQQAMPTSKKAIKRLPPTSGIEYLPVQGAAPKSVPRPSSRRSDEAASDPPSSNQGDDDDDDGDGEDPGEGSHGRSRKPTRKHDQVSESSEEMVAGEEKPPPASPKRTLESGEQAESNRQRIDEGTTTVEERSEKITTSESSHVRRLLQARSAQTSEKVLRTEHPRYHDDEEVESDEFDEMEVEMEDYDEDFPDYESDGEQEQASHLPTWSHSFEEGPPKLTEDELEKVDVVSREKEIDSLMKMKNVEGTRSRSGHVELKISFSKGCLRLATSRE